MSNQLVASQAHIPPNQIVTVSYHLRHIKETTTQETVNKALQQTEWAWRDVMTALNAVGQAIPLEHQETAKRAIFERKLEVLLKREGGYYDN